MAGSKRHFACDIYEKKIYRQKLKIKDSIFVKNLSELNKKISNIEINPKEILFMQFEK